MKFLVPFEITFFNRDILITNTIETREIRELKFLELRCKKTNIETCAEAFLSLFEGREQLNPRAALLKKGRKKGDSIRNHPREITSFGFLLYALKRPSFETCLHITRTW